MTYHKPKGNTTFFTPIPPLKQEIKEKTYVEYQNKLAKLKKMRDDLLIYEDKKTKAWVEYQKYLKFANDLRESIIKFI